MYEADSVKHELFEGKYCSLIILSYFPSTLQLKPIICWRVWGFFPPQQHQATVWQPAGHPTENVQRDETNEVFGHADAGERVIQRYAIARAKVSSWENVCCVEGIANGPLKGEKNEKKHKRWGQRRGRNPDFRAFCAFPLDLNWKLVHILSRLVTGRT